MASHKGGGNLIVAVTAEEVCCYKSGGKNDWSLLGMGTHAPGP